MTDSTVGVTDANTVDADTNGVITATLTTGGIASFSGLTGTGNAYTVTVNDTASIAQLTTLDGKTTGTITYTLVSDAATNLDESSDSAFESTGVAVTVTDATDVDTLSLIDTLWGTVTASGGIADLKANITGTLVNATGLTFTDTSTDAVTFTAATDADATDDKIGTYADGSSATLVDLAGEWAFVPSTHVLTYFDGIAATTVTLTGIATVTADGTGAFVLA